MIEGNGPRRAENCAGVDERRDQGRRYPHAEAREIEPEFSGAVVRRHGAGRGSHVVVTAIMGVFTPDLLPVLSGLATGYAVCDHWFSSVPTETFPNRAFICAATSQGHMDDATSTSTSQSIFGLLGAHGLNWAIYGYDSSRIRHCRVGAGSVDRSARTTARSWRRIPPRGMK